MQHISVAVHIINVEDIYKGNTVDVQINVVKIIDLFNLTKQCNDIN